MQLQLQNTKHKAEPVETPDNSISLAMIKNTKSTQRDEESPMTSLFLGNNIHVSIMTNENFTSLLKQSTQ